MNTFVDEEQLTNILKTFYELTRLKVTVFGVNHDVLAEYPLTHCPFCAYINDCKKGKELCEISNWKAFDECSKTKKVITYKCHTGLVEVVIPLIKHNNIIGYVIFGQVTNNKSKKEIIEKTKNLSEFLDYKKAISNVSQIKYHSKSKIKAEAKILEICALYFITNDMINSHNDQIISRALDYLYKNYAKEFDVNDLCEYLGISRTKLYNTFKKERDKGVVEILREIRIDIAKEKLLTTDLSVKEISYLVGFIDTNYFIQTFKKYFKTTPGNYRKTNKV